MADGDMVRDIQGMAAASSDGLLDISNGIGKLILQYGRDGWDVCNLECSILEARCLALEKKLSAAVKAFPAPEGTGEGTPDMQAPGQGAAITGQLLAQNLLALSGMACLLRNLKNHSAQIRSCLETADLIKNAAILERLRHSLEKIAEEDK